MEILNYRYIARRIGAGMPELFDSFSILAHTQMFSDTLIFACGLGGKTGRECAYFSTAQEEWTSFK